MYHKIKSLAIAIFITSNLLFTISVSAANDNSAASQQSINLPSENDLKKSNKTKEGKTKIKVIKKSDGKREIDNEPDVKMTKDQEKNYNQCKKEVEKTRTPKYKNKPTPCSKVPVDLGEFTDQDYNILWDNVLQSKEKLAGVDMSKEIPIEDYLKEADVIGESNSSSVSSTSNTSIYSSSSVSSNNTSSNISSSSSLFSSSTTSSQTNSQPSSIQSVSSSSKISLLDVLFGTMSVSAAQNDGFRMPWVPGTTATLEQTAFNTDTGGIWGTGRHASHWNVAAFDFALSNPEVRAAKEGTVVWAGIPFPGALGFGYHVVVQSPDGSVSLYAHLSGYNPVYGDTVTRGQKIGTQGQSGGQNSPHLHFETFNRIPCDITGYIEKCLVSNSTGYGGNTFSTYYLNSAMLPKFDECYTSSGLASTPGRCTNGYPSTLYQPLGSINQIAVVNYPKILFRRKNTNQCIDINGPVDGSITYTWDCMSWNQNQQWEVIPSGNDGYKYRRFGTNQCLEAYNPQTEGTVYTWTCDGSQEQRFNFNWSSQNLFRVGTANNNQCVAKGSPSNGVRIKMYTCSAAPNNVNFQWDIIGV